MTSPRKIGQRARVLLDKAIEEAGDAYTSGEPDEEAWAKSIALRAIEAALRSTGGEDAYRSQDAGGSPEAAGNVGWRWIEELANVEREDGAVLLEIHSSPVDCDGRTITLYRGTRLLACATIFRDPMNFAVLVRWQAPAPPVSDTGGRG